MKMKLCFQLDTKVSEVQANFHIQPNTCFIFILTDFYPLGLWVHVKFHWNKLFFLTCGCFVIVRSSNQSNKPVKLPVTPSTATLAKTQKNKTKNKKKPVEQKTTKQSVSPAKNTSIPAPSSSQVTGFACSLKYIIIWWNYILV